MQCPHQIPDDVSAYLIRVSRRMEENRVPAAGSVSLTNTCNFDCIHCYLGYDCRRSHRRSEELSTDSWLAIIDEITQAGCLFLLFTGGEPLLRKDFSQIYLHAKKNGLIVTVFSNGSLITEDIAAIFGEFPPHQLELSIYGTTPETYRRITGAPSALADVTAGIETLRKNRIRFQLKTVLMKPNRQEFHDMQQLAIHHGVPFRFDAAIFGSFAGDKSPMKYRVAPEDAVDLEMADDHLVEGWKSYCSRMETASIPDTLYQCGAGITSFHIDPAANLQPCIMPTGISYNILRPGGFQHGWYTVLPGIRNKPIGGDLLECSRCEKRHVCSYCPAFFALETGSEMRRSPYLCAQAHRRHEILFS